MVQGKHVIGKGRLQRRETINLVQHNLSLGIPAQFDHDADAMTVGFVTQVRDAFHLLFPNKIGNFLDQGCLIHLIRNFGDDDAVAVTHFNIGNTAH